MNLNQYFNNPKKFRNKIIVISAKDSANSHFGKFVKRNEYQLKTPLSFRDSYVAVVDMKNNFLYERVSQSRINCSYQVENKYIDIVSAGFSCGNNSSICVNNQEFSFNKRGLNFVIFNHNLKCLDRFYVDSHEDKDLNILKG